MTIKDFFVRQINNNNLIRTKNNRLLIIILLTILTLLFNFFLLDYFLSEYLIYHKKESLEDNIGLINLVLEEKKTQLSGYAKTIATFPYLLELNKNDLHKRLFYSLYAKLDIRGVVVRDSNLELIFKTGSGLELRENKQLLENIYQAVKEGYTFSYFSETYLFELQINAISGIYDEYNIDVSGIIIVTDVINKEYIEKLSNKIDGVINFYKKSDLEVTNRDLLSKIEKYKGKGYYLERKIINGKGYLIGYLPVKDFYNQTLGYFTVMKPVNNTYNFSWKIWFLMLISLVVVLFLNYCFRRLASN